MMTVAKMKGKKTLVLGGVRSGKTAYGMACSRKLKLSQDKGGALIYLATAEGFDEGMRDRIARHQKERAQDTDVEWSLVEAPIDIVTALQGFSTGDIVLVDCLSVWLSNLMYHQEQQQEENRENFLNQEINRLVAGLTASPLSIVLVGSEVGLGFLPLNAEARLFGDMQGILHQRIAAMADDVFMVVAGLPLQMKGDKSEH